MIDYYPNIKTADNAAMKIYIMHHLNMQNYKYINIFEHHAKSETNY